MSTFFGLLNNINGQTYASYYDDEHIVTYLPWKDLTKEQKQDLKQRLEPWQICMLKDQLKPFMTDMKVCARQLWEFSSQMHQVIHESGDPSSSSKLCKALESTVAANYELSERLLFDSLSLVGETKSID